MRPVDGPALDRLYLEHVASLETSYGMSLARTGWDAVVVHSGKPTRRSPFDDQFWPLRPVPHWQHWVPLREADCALVVRPGRRPVLLRPVEQSFWERSAPPETQAVHRAFEVVDLVPTTRLNDYIGTGRVAYIGDDPSGAERWGVPAERINPSPLIAALDALRVLKTPYEVACIVEANRKAQAGHEALRNLFRAGAPSELDMHLAYLRATAQDDWETPYKNIVALGPNAATLHHVAYGRSGSGLETESLLVDAGATCRGYAADITRTWVKGTSATASVFAALVAAVDSLQRTLCNAVRRGMAYESLHDQAHPLVATALRNAGVWRGSVEEGVDTGVTRAFFPHGLGHSLGLQTHDVGCALRRPRTENAFLRNTADVQAGQVFTVEPGIYFIAALLDPLRASPGGRLVDWTAVDALAPLGGIRIEDDLHVEVDSPTVRNLTREVLPVGGGSP